MRLLIGHAPTPVRWFVVDASAVTNIDYSAAQSLRALIAELQQQGVTLAFARVGPGLRDDIVRHGVAAAVGEGNLFVSLHEAVATAQAALALPPAG